MPRRTLPLLAAVAALVTTIPAGADSVPFETVIQALPSPQPDALPPIPPGFGIQLVLDDDNAEASVGVVQGQGAKQFLWFNRFTPAVPFRLEEIWVLFPAGQATIGDAIQLVVFFDPDGDPLTGATLLLAQNDVVQVADGNTFSIYPLAPELDVPAGGDVLIGVVNRWTVSGVTPFNFPASLDNTSSQARSWVAIWNADPPATPSLPGDVPGQTGLVDTVVGEPGNWLIRGFGQPTPILEIPTLSPVPLAVLAGALLLVGLVWLRRRPTVRPHQVERS